MDNSISLKFIVRALKYKNYRLFFIGNSVSLIGTWMQAVAASWLIYRLTNSVFLLGVVGFTSQIPTLLISSFAGVLADRFNRRKILIITQAMAMLQALIMAALTLTGTIQTWHIICLSIFLGLINSFDIPTRHSFVVDMIEKKEDIGNAIALNSSLFNAARLIGPSIAGILIASFGEGICFFINGVSFMGVIFGLLAMDIKRPASRQRKSHVLQELKEGLIYVVGFGRIRNILFLLALVSLAGMSHAVLMPVFARDVLGGGPHTLGFLMAAVGMGALIGTVYLASRRKVDGLEDVISPATIVFGVTILAFSFSKFLWLSLFLMVFAGFGIMVQMAASNTILQTLTDDDKRGRVMSFYTMAFMGMAPFGSLMAGGVASRLGAPNSLVISGFLCVLGAVLFNMNRSR
ncbi:MAG: MFS transporter [Candidatus Omnitrophota bacterium]